MEVKPIAFECSPNMIDMLDKIAKERDMSRSAVIRTACKKYIEEQGEIMQEEE